MIKIVNHKTKISIECSHADWEFLRWCLNEGMMAWMGVDDDDEDENPSGSDAIMRAWKRNGRPWTTTDLPLVHKKEAETCTS